jgi:DNA-binding NtrC family response regulator
VTWKPGLTLEDVKRAAILEALHHFNGNKAHTAEALKMGIRTLRLRLKKYAKEKEDECK